VTICRQKLCAVNPIEPSTTVKDVPKDKGRIARPTENAHAFRGLPIPPLSELRSASPGCAIWIREQKLIAIDPVKLLEIPEAEVAVYIGGPLRPSLRMSARGEPTIMTHNRH